MRIGRNFTNTFLIEVLTDEQRDKIFSGESLFSMNAWGSMKFKQNIEMHIDLAKRYNISHVELDCDTPSPYLDFNKAERRKIKNLFKKNGITVSVHFPYTMSAASNIASLQELERKTAVEILKKHLQFAAEIGAETVVIHPGKIPFYFCSEVYKKSIHNQLIKSLIELGKIANQRNIKFHVENNTAFDNLCVEVPDCVEVIKAVIDSGVQIYFNFDIGHWITKGKLNHPLPTPVESILDEIPSNMVYEFHLNDYLIEEGIFHPPLVLQKGLLKKQNLINYANKIKEKGVKLLVVESAFHNLDEIKSRNELIEQETNFLNEIFGNRPTL